jgi:hypothetical protein
VVSDNRCSLRATCKAAAEFFGDLPKQQLESFHFITTAEVLTLLSRTFTAQTGDVCFLFEALCGAIDLAVMQPPANFYSIQHVNWRMAEPFLTVSTSLHCTHSESAHFLFYTACWLEDGRNFSDCEYLFSTAHTQNLLIFYSIQHVGWRMAETFLTVSTLSPLHTLRICSFFILSSMLAGGWQNLF